MGEPSEPDLITRVIDQLILPAATCGQTTPETSNEKEDS
jgi:hypothetical protein